MQTSQHKEVIEKFQKAYQNMKEDNKNNLGNTYTYIEKEDYMIGKGDFGEVFIGYKTRDKTWVAVKVCSKKLEEDPNEVETMKKLAALDPNRLNNILFLYDSFIKERHYVLVVELCDFTLTDYLLNPKSLSERNELANQLLLALLYLHNKDIAHRDLKPENLMLKVTTPEKKTVLKLCDYGVCKREFKLSSRPATKYGDIKWRAPDKAFKDKFIYPNDIFTASMLIVYILSNGKHPFLLDNDYPLKLQAKFDDVVKANIREDISISHEVRKFLNNIFLEYCNLLNSGNTKLPELQSIENFRKKYQDLYFVRNPEYTQGLRYMIFIRFDYLYTRENYIEDGNENVEEINDDVFQGSTDVLMYRERLGKCGFVEKEALRSIDKERMLSTVCDPSQEYIEEYLEVFKTKFINDHKNPGEPFYVFIPIIAHGCCHDDTKDIRLDIPKSIKDRVIVNKNGILLTKLVRLISEKLGDQARLIVVCDACRSGSPPTGCTTELQFPPNVFVLYSRVREEDAEAYSSYSTKCSDFCRLLSDEIKPGKKLSELKNNIIDKGGDFDCSNIDLFDNFIF